MQVLTPASLSKAPGWQSLGQRGLFLAAYVNVVSLQDIIIQTLEPVSGC